MKFLRVFGIYIWRNPEMDCLNGVFFFLVHCRCHFKCHSWLVNFKVCINPKNYLIFLMIVNDVLFDWYSRSKFSNEVNFIGTNFSYLRFQRITIFSVFDMLVTCIFILNWFRFEVKLKPLNSETQERRGYLILIGNKE